MSEHTDRTAEELTRALHRRVDDLQEAPLTLAHVRGRAREIRRTRRVVTAVGLATAAALLVPVALLAGGGLDRAEGPGPASTRPSPSASSPSVVVPSPVGTVPLELSGLDRGAATAVPWISADDGVLHTGADTLRLPRRYDQVTPYGEGWLALRLGNADAPATATIDRLDANLDEVASTPSGPALVRGDDGARVAWVEFEKDRAVLVSGPSDGGPTTRRDLPSYSVRPLGFLDGDRIAVETEEADGTRAYDVVDPDGSVTAVRDVLRVVGTSAATGTVVALTQEQQDGSYCSGALDVSAGGGLLWQTCDYLLGPLSPDGRFVLGLSPEALPGSATLSILDARTGTALVDFVPRATGTTVGQAVWEDGEHVLALVSDGSTETMLRAGPDGGLEQVGDPLPVDPMSVSAWFASVPRA